MTARRTAGAAVRLADLAGLDRASVAEEDARREAERKAAAQ